MTNKIKYIVYKSSTVIILFIVMAFFQIINMARGESYLTWDNLSTVINQAAFLVLVGLAQLMAVLTGGINLAIGSIMVLTCIVAGDFLVESGGVCFLIPVMIMIAFSSAIGFLNGAVITKLGIPSFIATFGILYVFRGIAWIVMGRKVLYRIHPTIRFLAGGKLFHVYGFTVTMPMVITLAFLAVMWFILKKTSYGRELYFTGSNKVAARFSGIPTDRIIITAHIISGFLCGVCAIMYSGRLNAAEPGMYGDTHFTAVSVVLIGGASMTGGEGDVWATAVGAVIIAFIQSGMNSIQVPSEFQNLVLGALIILSVMVNQNLQKKKSRLENDIRNI